MRRLVPVLTLFILSPFLAEVLFGATPLSNLAALVVVMPLYGGGAVLVRELARRRGTGWGRIFLLGAAYGMIEEGLIIQSLFDANMFNAGLVGGRAFGVNWIWTLWTLGYHIVWSISIPILLAELLFSARRSEPWLEKTGLIVVGVLYGLGALALAAIYRFAVAPDFEIPVVLNIITALIAILLVMFALRRPAGESGELSRNTDERAPSPWTVGLLGLLMAGLWFGLLDLPHFLRTGAWAFVPIVLGIALVAGFASLIRSWSHHRSWSDLHRLALVFGPLIVGTLWGIFQVTAGNPLDQLGISILALITLILLALFARRLQRRDHEAEVMHNYLRSSHP
jgi:hypothetical protein